MSTLYFPTHRRLQDRFDTRPLADRVEEIVVHAEFSDMDKAFIESRDMFFLSTVDPDGSPTVSYKGGAPGFVRIDDGVLTFPCYDGNGMFLSAGNLAQTSKVGLLFMDFENPIRIRVQGEASIDEATDGWPGALFLVRVRPTRVWPNCGRYIHPHKKIEQSRHVPDAAGEQPLAVWKRIDAVQDVLPEDARAAAAEAGVIDIETWVATGER